jgi:hypothetical protein
MTESNLHKIVKNGVAQALLQDGFNTQTEYKSQDQDEGKIDVYASKPDGEIVKVEVVKTHIPNWLLIKLDSNYNIRKQLKTHTLAISHTNYDFLNNLKKGTESFDNVLSRILPLIKTQTMETVQ